MFWPHMGGGFGWGGWLVGGLLMLLFLGTFVALVYFLIRASNNNHSSSGRDGTSNNALEILKQCYARGDISKEEFETIRTDLGV